MDVYSKYASLQRIQIYWLKFSFIEELMYEINVGFEEKFPRVISDQ
jgi:hypothetical protein